MERIRYKKHPNVKNAVISISKYYSEKTKSIYRITLFLDRMEYLISVDKSDHCHRNKRKITNLNALKRSAKNRLIRLGVKFTREYRDRTFGRCDIGYSQDKHEELFELLPSKSTE